MDLPINGQSRKVLVHFDRNAYAYTIDRVTGEVLEASTFAYQNWSSGFDMKSGTPMVVADKQPRGESWMPIRRGHRH